VTATTGTRTDPARPGFEQFPHGADIGVRGFGPDKETAFEQAALALTAALIDPQALAPHEAVAISASAPDDELLLVEWLNAIIYEMATRRMLFGRFEARINGNRLEGTAWGESMEPYLDRLGTEVKGATLTAIKVAQDANGRWIAQCVIDV
jgi:tRNA nucleotidyltransferase (CCA-adding enzyme)